MRGRYAVLSRAEIEPHLVGGILSRPTRGTTQPYFFLSLVVAFISIACRIPRDCRVLLLVAVRVALRFFSSLPFRLVFIFFSLRLVRFFPPSPSFLASVPVFFLFSSVCLRLIVLLSADCTLDLFGFPAASNLSVVS